MNAKIEISARSDNDDSATRAELREVARRVVQLLNAWDGSFTFEVTTVVENTRTKRLGYAAFANSHVYHLTNDGEFVTLCGQPVNWDEKCENPPDGRGLCRGCERRREARRRQRERS